MMTKLPPPGLDAFRALRAEEEPWGAACYVPPAEFPLMTGARAALIFGEVGSGKTALRQALERAWRAPTAAPPWLLVPWQFNALTGSSEALAGSALAARQQLQAFDAVGRALLIWIIQQPSLWQAAPAWARTILTWFIRKYLAGDPLPYVESLIEEGALPSSALPGLSDIMAAEQGDLLSPDASPVAVMDMLARALPRFGLSGIRIVLEGIEPWWEAHPAQVSTSLQARLSTLALFENPMFAYTFVLPAELWDDLRQTTGVRRRRVQTFPLRFQEAELVKIVERRLALALGQTDASLSDLGPADSLRAWLRGCGGTVPRGWLETARPFLVTYLAQPEPRRPLAEDACRAVQLRHPPALWIEAENGPVTVGWRRVEGLSRGQLGILRYLMDHVGETCSRKALYRAYQQASNEAYCEKDLPTNKEIEDTLNTALYRLRTAIEPVPELPVLLETRRGQGVRLRSPARG